MVRLARTCCVVLNCSGLHPHGPLHCVYPWSIPGLPHVILKSPGLPRFSNVCRLRIIKTRTERGRPGTEATHYAYWLFSLFSRHISRTQSFQQNRQFLFRALVALKMLVSLISRLVACSPRIVVDKQTDTHTERLL